MLNLSAIIFKFILGFSKKYLTAFLLRIFKYARRRIIALSLENQMLRVQLEYYRAIVESDFNKKH